MVTSKKIMMMNKNPNFKLTNRLVDHAAKGKNLKPALDKVKGHAEADYKEILKAVLGIILQSSKEKPLKEIAQASSLPTKRNYSKIITQIKSNNIKEVKELISPTNEWDFIEALITIAAFLRSGLNSLEKNLDNIYLDEEESDTLDRMPSFFDKESFLTKNGTVDMKKINANLKGMSREDFDKVMKKNPEFFESLKGKSALEMSKTLLHLKGVN